MIVPHMSIYLVYPIAIFISSNTGTITPTFDRGLTCRFPRESRIVRGTSPYISQYIGSKSRRACIFSLDITTQHILEEFVLQTFHA
jgi:hypothetical protein